MCGLQQYDPRGEKDRAISVEEISLLLMRIQEQLPHAVLLKSIEGCGIQATKNFEREKTGNFLSKLFCN